MAKKVSFSKKRKEYGGEKLVEVISHADSIEASEDGGRAVRVNSKGEVIEGGSGDDDDEWDEAADLSKPQRNVTDTPKPKIFAPEPSFLAIPLHLLAILYAIFDKFDVQSDVDGGLLNGMYLLFAAQLIYGVVLTVITNKSRRNLHAQAHTHTHSHGKKPKKSSSTASFGSGDVLNISFAFVLSLAASVPIYVILLLFGAPIGSYMERTYQLALHLSLITVYPLLCTYRLSDSDFKECWANLLTFQVSRFYSNQVYAMAIGGWVGCWIGVIPIPLDWDRPWQQWPITLVGGAYLGAVLGNLIGFTAASLDL